MHTYYDVLNMRYGFPFMPYNHTVIMSLYRDTLQMIVSLQLVRRRLPRIDPMMPYHNNCAYFLVFSWISAATKHYDSLYFHSYIIK